LSEIFIASPLFHARNELSAIPALDPLQPFLGLPLTDSKATDVARAADSSPGGHPRVYHRCRCHCAEHLRFVDPLSMIARRPASTGCDFLD
jgi:hypothetical protein